MEARMVSSTFVAGDGAGYEAQMGRWSRRLAPRLIDFAGIRQGASVLDVGSGTGNLAFALAENPAIGRVQGIDYVPAYVEHARNRNRDARVDFRVGDATELPFADASFDHALSMLVLQFVPQSDIAVREMRRVTRPGGTVAAATWDARGGFVAFRMFFDTAAMIDPAAGERRARTFTRPLSGPGGLARAWEAAGLQNVVQDMVTIRMDFESFADHWTPYEGRDGPVADYVRTLDESTKSRIKDAVRSAYLDGEPDGPRSYAATAWVVKGSVPA
jgi:SAM-dependent methyltransferase